MMARTLPPGKVREGGGVGGQQVGAQGKAPKALDCTLNPTLKLPLKELPLDCCNVAKKGK
jgi:hypothetical protein